VVYLEIAGLTAQRLKAFYADVFGWRMDGAKRPGLWFVPIAEAGGVLWVFGRTLPTR